MVYENPDKKLEKLKLEKLKLKKFKTVQQIFEIPDTGTSSLANNLSEKKYWDAYDEYLTKSIQRQALDEITTYKDRIDILVDKIGLTNFNSSDFPILGFDKHDDFFFRRKDIENLEIQNVYEYTVKNVFVSFENISNLLTIKVDFVGGLNPEECDTIYYGKINIREDFSNLIKILKIHE